MKKYLLHIKRQNPAPRPPEADLEWENIDGEGIPKFLKQNPTQDSYVQVRSDKDPAITMLELQAMEETSPIKRNKQSDSGFLWPYPYSDRLTNATEPRSKTVTLYDEDMMTEIGTEVVYSTITLRVLSEAGGETEYTGATALAQAQAAAEALADTDGFVIIDNLEGERTEVISSRPWIVETEDNKPTIELKNQFEG